MEEGHLDFSSAMKKLQGNIMRLYPVFLTVPSPEPYKLKHVSAKNLNLHLARPWLKDDLDAWIERLKVSLLFNSSVACPWWQRDCIVLFTDEGICSFSSLLDFFVAGTSS